MTEITIHGRGGQGGVTLAKLISSAYFLRNQYVQAFGVYAAERSGAPVQAFVRIDDQEITNHNQVRAPDHVIVIDRALIRPAVAARMKPGGWIILNTPETPEAYAEMFPGRNLATVDATAIAVSNGLGTRAVPIVNTTVLGATLKVLGLDKKDVDGALELVGFGGPNVTSGEQAFDRVVQKTLPGEVQTGAPPSEKQRASLFDEDVGGMPVIHTGDWASRHPHRRNLTPPCHQGCPAGNRVRDFVQAVGQKEYDEALAIVLETSPFPSTCGRVCPAPCMEICNRCEHDEPVNVREIERYIGDNARRPDVTKPTRAERVAVIGSGPAGLATTYHLARLGYPVSLFESGKELGGVMRTGIPAYRLPRDVLDQEISYIIRHGVDVHTRAPVNRQILVDLSHQYAAIFVATGLQEVRALNLGQVSSNIVTQGIDFLDRAREGDEFMTGLRVVVVGGGNTAMDAARTALRLGARSVQVVYRRTRNEMPAIAEEIDEALEEGVELHELVQPVRLHEDAKGTAVTCQRMRLGDPDESGRRRPVPIESEDAQFELRCDRVIAALGQSPDLTVFPEGTDVRDGEQLVGLAGCPIFAGGDFATNDGTVTAAIGSGHRAALHIHKTITGENLFPPDPPEVAGKERMTLHVFEHRQRERGAILPPETRTRSFAEVRLGLRDEPGHEAAAIEAARCLSCGVCNDCDRCLSYCPEGIMIHRGDGEYEFDYEYCKGCGICATQCPRGVVYMTEL